MAAKQEEEGPGANPRGTAGAKGAPPAAPSGAVDPAPVSAPASGSRSAGSGAKEASQGLRPPRMNLQTFCLVALLVLAIFYTLYFAKTFFLPIVVAVLLNFLLAPAVRALERIGLPRALAAGLTLFLLLAAVLGLGYQVLDPAKRWVEKAPRELRKVERKLRQIREPVEDVSRAAEKVGELARGGGSPEPGQVQIKKPSTVASLLSGGQAFLASAAVIYILLFFLLATDDLVLRKLVRLLPRLEDRKKAVWIARRIERDISAHLLTVSVINLCLGVAVGTALYFIGMPSPVLWGVMAAALNFVPYLGAAVGVTVLAAVSLLTFDTVTYAVLAPAAYLALTSVEGGLITPVILGRRLSLNPVAVFVGLFFWGWLWGVPGALLAVPILASVKIFCDRVERLTAVGAILGR